MDICPDSTQRADLLRADAQLGKRRRNAGVRLRKSALT